MQSLSTQRFFIYDWVLHDPFDPKKKSQQEEENKNNFTEEKCMSLRAYCIPSNSSSITLIEATGFRPWIYVTLPDGISKNILDVHSKTIFKMVMKVAGIHYLADCDAAWKRRPNANAGLLQKKCYKCFGGKMTFVQRGRLYYGHSLVRNGAEQPWFLRIYSDSETERRRLRFAMDKKPISFPFLPQSPPHVMKVYEGEASPILQMTTQQKLPTLGWIRLQIPKGQTPLVRRTTTGTILKVPYEWIRWCPEIPTMPKPTILSFDLETYSSDPTRMPSAENEQDAIFQIGVSIQMPSASSRKVLLCVCPEECETLFQTQFAKNPGTSAAVGVECIVCHDELELLQKFRALWLQVNPHVVTGYNIFGFDFPYIIERCRYYDISEEFFKLGPFLDEASIKVVNWSSSAYRDQHFTFPLTQGVLIVDLLPLVRRDFKLSNYKLKTVSSTFLGDTKDPLTPQDLFRAYECLCLGRSRDMNDACRQMVEVGQYCLQDADLVLRLFGHLQTWVGLCEMARICQVSFWSLYTQGQQIKVFSQIYRYCQEIRYVIDPPATPDILPYTGAHVFPPQPGIYSWVVPFDFSSLYPTTIIAYNIDYSTFIPEELWDQYPDPDSHHAIEWDEHTCCEHDHEVYTPATRPTYVYCGKRAFRFLKEPKGVLPTLLETLLRQRKETRKEMKTLTDSAEDKAIYEVLDKRQMAYKVSANSAYGAMGVSRGYLPFMPGAMCTTAMGRFNINKAATYVQENYGASLIYGDTDSIYVHFPGITNAKELWDHSVNIEENLTSLFLPPMKLAFEEKLYKKFLILTKKRYMALTCDASGIIDKKLTIRGVLLARRDNCAWVRKIYEQIVRGLMASRSMEDIQEMLSENMLEVFQHRVPISEFIVTKLIGSSYVIQPLISDVKKRGKRLKDLGIDFEWYQKEEVLLKKNKRCRCPVCSMDGGGGTGTADSGVVVEMERWVMGIETMFSELFDKDNLRLTFANQSRLTSSDYLSMVRESTLMEWWEKTRGVYYYSADKSQKIPEAVARAASLGVLEFVAGFVNKTTSVVTTESFPDKQTLAARGWNPIMVVIFQEYTRHILDLDTAHEMKISLPLTNDQLRKYLTKEAFNKNQKILNHCRGKCPCGSCRYYQRSLPAHVQLSLKMQRRGNLVSPGTRLEYVVVETREPKAKLFDKLEDPVYVKTNAGDVNLDFFYYMHLLEFPMDQLLSVCFKRPLFQELVKIHKHYQMVLEELHRMFRPRFLVHEAVLPYNEVLTFEQ